MSLVAGKVAVITGTSLAVDGGTSSMRRRPQQSRAGSPAQRFLNLEK